MSTFSYQELAHLTSPSSLSIDNLLNPIISYPWANLRIQNHGISHHDIRSLRKSTQPCQQQRAAAPRKPTWRTLRPRPPIPTLPRRKMQTPIRRLRNPKRAREVQSQNPPAPQSRSRRSARSQPRLTRKVGRRLLVTPRSPARTQRRRVKNARQSHPPRKQSKLPSRPN